jgi:G patch domain and KOW motifs-containing protein
VTQEYELGTG